MYVVVAWNGYEPGLIIAGHGLVFVRYEDAALYAEELSADFRALKLTKRASVASLRTVF